MPGKVPGGAPLASGTPPVSQILQQVLRFGPDQTPAL